MSAYDDILGTDDSPDFLGWFNGTVQGAYWSNDITEAKDKSKVTYDGADRTNLYLPVRVDEILQEWTKPVIPEQVNVKLTIGDKWWPSDDPFIVQHEDDETEKLVKFKGQSRYGQILRLAREGEGTYQGRLVVADGGPEPDVELGGLAKHFLDIGITTTRDSRIWNGCQFEFRGVKFPTGKNPDPRMSVLPFVYLGWDEAVASTSGLSSAAGADAETALFELTERVARALPGDTEPATVEALAALVQSSTSHAAFMRAALKLPEVKGDEAVADAVKATDGVYSVR